jgi:hypothetical protein
MLNVPLYIFTSYDTTANAFGIATAFELDMMDEIVSLSDGTLVTNTINYKLLNAIDLSVLPGFDPIGTDTVSFDGTFDGQNFEIQNVAISATGANTGLFGTTGTNAVIKNLGVRGTAVDASGANTSVISGNGNTGGIVGVNNGTITNSYVQQINISGFGNNVGGIAGINNGTIENAYSYANVNGTQYVGGLVGKNTGTITATYTKGVIGTNSSNNVGGLVGTNQTNGTINYSYTTAKVFGMDVVGGLLGDNTGGSVANAYATGEVKGSTNVGYLAGMAASGINNTTTYHYEYQVISPKGGNGYTGESIATTQDLLNQNGFQDTVLGGKFDTAQSVNAYYPAVWDRDAVPQTQVPQQSPDMISVDLILTDNLNTKSSV